MKKDRSEYQKQYADDHRQEKRDQKALERYRKGRCKSYWYARLVLKREMPTLIADCSPEMVESERVRYGKTIRETR